MNTIESDVFEGGICFRMPLPEALQNYLRSVVEHYARTLRAGHDGATMPSSTRIVFTDNLAATVRVEADDKSLVVHPHEGLCIANATRSVIVIEQSAIKRLQDAGDNFLLGVSALKHEMCHAVDNDARRVWPDVFEMNAPTLFENLVLAAARNCWAEYFANLYSLKGTRFLTDDFTVLGKTIEQLQRAPSVEAKAAAIVQVGTAFGYAAGHAVARDMQWSSHPTQFKALIEHLRVGKQYSDLVEALLTVDSRRAWNSRADVEPLLTAIYAVLNIMGIPRFIAAAWQSHARKLPNYELPG
jgi:hypothetical protein